MDNEIYSFDECNTPEEILRYFLQELKLHNDGDTNDREFCDSVGKLWEQAEKRLDWLTARLT